MSDPFESKAYVVPWDWDEAHLAALIRQHVDVYEANRGRSGAKEATARLAYQTLALLLEATRGKVRPFLPPRPIDLGPYPSEVGKDPNRQPDLDEVRRALAEGGSGPSQDTYWEPDPLDPDLAPDGSRRRD